MKFNLSDTFNKELTADAIASNSRRQVLDAAFSFVTPKKPKAPKLIHVSDEMAETLNISKSELSSNAFLNLFSGSDSYPETAPYAMCYGGHQFGQWAGQLGDGRAINLFEVESKNKRWALQLKGAGETPYSRSADGLAVLRSSIREYLCSEAMFHLGVPTTRALSLCLSGDKVLRDIMYNGNSKYEHGAIVCRVAPSFIRFGNFEIFAARNDLKQLKQLTDYTIKYFFNHLGTPKKQTYIAFFAEVAQLTLKMIIEWQRVGFTHGVMNTDNMSILGLTIDYGPYGWLEGFDYNWTPNTTDAQHRRYAYGSQPNMGLWNLCQLANALYPLVNDTKPFEDILEKYKKSYGLESLNMMRSKLGLSKPIEDDALLVSQLEDLLSETETDMTIFFRILSDFDYKSFNNFDLESYLSFSIYDLSKLKQKTFIKKWRSWFSNYSQRLAKEALIFNTKKQQMDAVNPKYILRNYISQMVIEAAEKEDYSMLDEVYNMIKNPYDNQEQFNKWFAKRPEWARHKVGCSMLSCSS